MPRALIAAALASLAFAAPAAASPVLVYGDGQVTKADDPALPPAAADPMPPVPHECGVAPLHALYIQPDLGGPDPMWVCEESGRAIAELWRLGARP